jgi:hypothetical protein
MRDRPTAAELLDVAQKTLREELMPLLPRDKIYTALMIANAMSIAGRQLRAGEGPQEQECRRLQEILKGVRLDATLPLQERLISLNRELARGIRAGQYGNENEGVKRFLWESALQRVRESSPRYLKAESIG